MSNGQAATKCVEKSATIGKGVGGLEDGLKISLESR